MMVCLPALCSVWSSTGWLNIKNALGTREVGMIREQICMEETKFVQVVDLSEVVDGFWISFVFVLLNRQAYEQNNSSVWKIPYCCHLCIHIFGKILFNDNSECLDLFISASAEIIAVVYHNSPIIQQLT